MAVRKSFVAEIEVEEGERAVVATITTASVDREGEVVIPDGVKTTEFMNGGPGTVFWQHDYNVPIGKCVKIKRDGDRLVAKTVFASRPATHPEGKEWLPDTLFDLYRQKVIKGFSIGFQPLEVRNATTRDKTLYGESCERVFSKTSLIEFSGVTVPANSDAVALAVSKGIVSKSAAKALFNLDVDGVTQATAAKSDDGDDDDEGEDDTAECKGCGEEMPKSDLNADGLCKACADKAAAKSDDGDEDDEEDDDAKPAPKSVTVQLTSEAPPPVVKRVVAIEVADAPPVDTEAMDRQRKRGRIYLA